MQQIAESARRAFVNGPKNPLAGQEEGFLLRQQPSAPGAHQVTHTILLLSTSSGH